jgi:hypothetical protein
MKPPLPYLAKERGGFIYVNKEGVRKIYYCFINIALTN